MFSSVIWVCRNSTTYLRGLLRTKYESAFPVQCLNRFWFYYQCLCPDPPNQAFSKGFTQPSQSYQLRQAFVRPSSGRGAGIQMGVCRTGPQEGPLLQLQMALPTAPFPAGARAGWQLGSGWRPQRQLCSSKTRVFCNVFQWDKVS